MPGPRPSPGSAVRLGSGALLALAALSGCGGAGGPSGAARAPNVVVIVVDDAGYADFSFQGSELFRTPRIDSIAAGGVRFLQAYVTCSRCSPSRAALLTGRYQQRFGHEFNPPPSANRGYGLAESERTLADALRERGYATAAVGKWHLGLADNAGPLERGFDSFYGFLLGGRTYRSFGPGEGNDFKRLHRDRGLADEDFEYLTDELGEEAAAVVQRLAGRPFFLYLAFSALHGPLDARDEDLPPEDEVEGLDPERRTLVGMTVALDRAVGRVLDALDAQGVADDTLVFFLSDNGGSTVNGSDNGPYRGFKGVPYEGGVRVPMLARWPAALPAGASFGEAVSALDVFATVLSATGDVTSTLPLDGVDLAPWLRGEREGAPHDTLYWRQGERWAIRQGPWKLVQGFDTAPELFHLGRDPGEATDLSGEEPERVAAMAQAWETWSGQMNAPRWKKYTLDDEGND